MSVELADAPTHGAGTGDTITFVYNEALSAGSITSSLTGGTNNSLAAGTGNITGSLSELTAELGSFGSASVATATAAILTLSGDGTTITITLGGTVVDGAFPGGVFTPATTYTDTAGNTIDATVTKTATGTWDGTAPELVSVTLVDVGGDSGTAEVTDKITFLFGEALSAASIDGSLEAGGATISGSLAAMIAEVGSFDGTPFTVEATETTLALSADGMTVTITIASGGTITNPTGTFPSGAFTPSGFTDRAGNPVSGTAKTTTGTFSLAHGPIISADATPPTNASDTPTPGVGEASAQPSRDLGPRMRPFSTLTVELGLSVQSWTAQATPLEWNQPALTTSAFRSYRSVLSLPNVKQPDTFATTGVQDEPMDLTITLGTPNVSDSSSLGAVSVSSTGSAPPPSVAQSTATLTTATQAETTTIPDLLDTVEPFAVPVYQRTPAWLTLARLGIEPAAVAPEATVLGMSKTQVLMAIFATLILSGAVSAGVFLARKKKL